MPYTLKDPVRHKFTKKSYNVRDWATYDEGLKNRGSLTIWFSEDAIAAWNQGLCCTKENEDTSLLILVKNLCNTSAFGYAKCSHFI